MKRIINKIARNVEAVHTHTHTHTHTRIVFIQKQK